MGGRLLHENGGTGLFMIFRVHGFYPKAGFSDNLSMKSLPSRLRDG